METGIIRCITTYKYLVFMYKFVPGFTSSSSKIGHLNTRNCKLKKTVQMKKRLKKLLHHVVKKDSLSAKRIYLSYTNGNPLAVAHYCNENKDDFIREVTHIALTTKNEQLRIEVLRLLKGTDWPVASAILHWCHNDKYPILDFRALWSLGVDRNKVKVYDYDFWLGYTKYCRELSKKNRLLHARY